MDYGMKDKNPIDHVHFYSKTDYSQAKKITKNEVTTQVQKKKIPKNTAVAFGRSLQCFCIFHAGEGLKSIYMVKKKKQNKLTFKIKVYLILKLDHLNSQFFLFAEPK